MVDFVRKASKRSLLAMLRKAKELTPRLLARMFDGVLFKDEFEIFSAGGGIDHGNLGGLTDDDHTQYVRHNLSTAANDFLVGSGSDTFIKKTLAETGAILEADLDHGNIQGLADDDHTRYIDKDGTRELTADWDAGPHEIRAETLESDVATGTAPLTIASTTLVDNLNADQIDGYDEADFDYTLISGNDADTDVTGAELEELTDGSNTVLHTHDLSGDTICLASYIDIKSRTSAWNLHGGLSVIDTAHDLGAGDLVTTVGLGKILIAVIAANDFAGDITITGTTVDRNTGVETPADTDTLTIDALTTDDSDTDAEGNTRHSFTGAYMTTKWFLGSVTISSADTDITDMDTYQVAFEQLNDHSVLTLTTADLTAFANNSSAWMYGYLYMVYVDGDKCNIVREGALELPSTDVNADKFYRIRRGNLDIGFDGTTDGFWADLFPGPLNLAYWEDVNVKFWFELGGITTAEFAQQCWNAEDLTISATTLSNASAETPDDGSESVQLSSYSTMVAISGSPSRNLTKCWQADSGGAVGSTDVYMYLGETKGFIPAEGGTMRVEAVIWDDGTGAFGRVGMLSQDGSTGLRTELNGTSLIIDTLSGTWTEKVNTASGLTSSPSGACWYVLSMEYDFSDNGYTVRVIELGPAAATQEDVSISGTVAAPTFGSGVRLTKVYAQSAKTTQEVTERNGIAQLWVGDDSDSFPLGYKQTSNFVP